MKECNYCGKKFSEAEGLKLGGHKVWCSKNPKLKESKKKMSEKAKLFVFSEESKKKISDSVKDKIKKGTWHLSFSHSRTHEYKGEKFHGKWELAYAKWLDDNNIKWRRPKESFKYVFEGKERNYTPDFYLEDEKYYLEIKGYTTEKDIAKWEQFPLSLKVLKGKDLKELNLIESYKEEY